MRLHGYIGHHQEVCDAGFACQKEVLAGKRLRSNCTVDLDTGSTKLARTLATPFLFIDPLFVLFLFYQT